MFAYVQYQLQLQENFSSMYVFVLHVSLPSPSAEVTPLRCREMVLGDSHNEHDRVHSINLGPGAF